MTTSNDRYWRREIEDARELVEHAKGVEYAFVGLMRAQAILAVDEEMRRLRATKDARVGPSDVAVTKRYGPSDSDASHRDGPPNFNPD